MLRSFPRVLKTSSRVSATALRSSSVNSPILKAVTASQRRCESSGSHAISNPTLAQIEKRWEAMPPQEQASLWMALRDRMKNDWHDLTLQERKAAYWIAFGPHGPRALDPPGESLRVFYWTLGAVAISCLIFLGVREMAGPAPSTMTKEWQEATNEYLKSQNVEPISGISSEGYSGKGMVQSAPKKKE